MNELIGLDEVRAEFETELVQQFNARFRRLRRAPWLIREPYTFPYLVEETASYLEAHFDVERLTIIERAILLRSCLHAAKLYLSQLKEFVRNDKYSMHVIVPHKEAAWYWLVEALGVSTNEIIQNLFGSCWRGSPEFNEWIARERFRLNHGH